MYLVVKNKVELSKRKGVQPKETVKVYAMLCDVLGI